MPDISFAKTHGQPNPFSGTGFYPDLRYIKRQIPITDVARELDLQITGNGARCWRPESHKHGDRTPSVSFNKRKNIGRCFVCDDHAWSNIDLVQKVLQCSTREAINWIADRFRVPRVPKGKHLKINERWEPRFRVGTTAFELDSVIRSLFWAQLTNSERSLLPVLCSYADSAGVVKISYRGLMRYSGVRSFSTIAKALKRFQKISLLHVERAANEGLRACNTYVLTFDDMFFQELLHETYEHQQTEVQAEREIRTEQRNWRRRMRRAEYTGKTSLQPV